MAELSFLKLTRAWQKAIAAELWRSYPDRSELEQHRLVVQWITLLICLYFCDRRSLLPSGRLQAICTTADPDQQLIQLWQTYCNSAIDTTGWFNLAQLRLPAPLLQSMIDSLFYPRIDQFAQTPVESLGQIYEATFEATLKSPLPASPGAAGGQARSTSTFKKLSGIYYTPQSVVQSMVQSALARISTADISTAELPRILDPACGGGAFLLAAYQALYERQLQHNLNCGQAPDPTRLWQDAQQQWHLTSSEQQRLLRSIYGVDLDPQAVMITQLTLWLKTQEHCRTAPVPFRWNPNIRCGNAVIDTDYNSAVVLQHPADSVHPFNWQAHFPAVFQTGGFDLVIGNPPYVDAEWMTTHLPHWRTYCTRHYQTATGNWDLFCIFIERALQLCRPQGVSSLIVPNKLLSADYAQATRLLLDQHQLLALTDYSNVSVFSASVYPVVYIVQKTRSDSEHSVKQIQTSTFNQSGPFDSAPLSTSTPNSSTWVLKHFTDASLIQRLGQLPKLEHWVTVSGAATVAEAYLLKPLIRDCPILQPKELPLVNSGTIDRYILLWGQKPLRYLGQTYRHPVVAQTALHQLSSRRFAQAMQPKIIVAGMSQQLECALDATGGWLAGKSTTIIQTRLDVPQPIELAYILAVLNSRLISYYFQTCFQGNQLQGGYFRIGPAQIRSLPIVIPNLEQQRERQLYQQILDLVDQRLNQMNTIRLTPEQTDLRESTQAIDAKINAQVEQLYQLTDPEIQVLAEAGAAGTAMR